MEIQVKVKGIEEFNAKINARKFEAVVEKALEAFAAEAAKKMRDALASNGWGLPPTDRGGTPLYKTGTYANGYQSKGKQVVLEGDNRHMSNFALGQLLEFGNGAHPAKPHQRPWMSWVRKVAAAHVGKKVVDGLAGRT